MDLLRINQTALIKHNQSQFQATYHRLKYAYDDFIILTEFTLQVTSNIVRHVVSMVELKILI